MLNLNGHTVECNAVIIGLDDIIRVVGNANTVMGPGTREYMFFLSMMSIALHILLILYLINVFINSQEWIFRWYQFVWRRISYCEWCYDYLP